ncbi:unnamed protein product [Enterobius vermicularis]|uniref:Protein AATF n=1 Tax=Enterobius vermicularis TaxID=51028 RepID=A0A0N4VHS1_ENTVE|nr:unnamed protein product [Enterobius vermicularis]
MIYKLETEVLKYLNRRRSLDYSEKITINNTGSERLNDLLTEFINSPGDGERHFGILGHRRHVCYEDVKDLVEKLREEKEGKIIPEDPLQYEKFITDVAVAANEKVKEFIKKKYERSLDEHLVGEGLSPSEVKEQLEKDSLVPASTNKISWDSANLELSKIYENEREFPVTDDPLSTAIDGTCALDEDEEESGEEDDNGDDIGSLMDSGTEEALDEDFSEEESVEVQSGDSEENGLPGSCSAVGEDGTCKGVILQEPNDLTSTEHDHSLENQDSLASSEAITESCPDKNDDIIGEVSSDKSVDKSVVLVSSEGSDSDGSSIIVLS